MTPSGFDSDAAPLGVGVGAFCKVFYFVAPPSSLMALLRRVGTCQEGND